MKPHKISIHSAHSNNKALFTDPIFIDGFGDIVRLPRLDQALEMETRSIKDNRSDRDLSTTPALI